MAPTTNERVLVFGATGKVGSLVVKELLAKNVAVTAYVRNADKAAKTFTNVSGPLSIVQGDFNDFAALEKALIGHTRLFLMLLGLSDMVALKTKIATLAYASGIKQIVDLSCSTFNLPPRSNYIFRVHEDAEAAILNIPNRGRAVFLRPVFFMSNMLSRYPRGFETFEDYLAPDAPKSWVSPNDIASVAATVLADAIENHDDNIYELTSQVATSAELAQILSRVTGRTITYKQVSSLDRFNAMKTHFKGADFPVSAIYDLATMIEIRPHVSLGIAVLLGREPETLEAYFNSQKEELVV